MLAPSYRRSPERGQVVPIAALMFTVILGATAIAVDLSVQTNTRRTLQNVTDSATLAGARDLPGNPAAAVNDALSAIGKNLGFTSGWMGAGAVTCGAGKCANISLSSGGVSYTVQVNTPPTLTSNSALKDKFHIEAVIHRTSSTFVAGALGFANGTQGASSVAVHSGPNLPFGFALYSQTFETGGNLGETVVGDVYAGQFINPQSNGLADFCAGKDPNGNATIVLGAPQYDGTNGPTKFQQYGQAPLGTDPDTVHQVSSCSLVVGGSEVAQEASLGCPANITGISGYTFAQDSFTKACLVTPGISPPQMSPPTDGTFITEDGSKLGNNQTVLKVTGSLTPAVYKVIHNPNCKPTNCFDVDFSGSGASGTYNVTFWLEGGATIGVEKGANVTLNPYVPSPSAGNDGQFFIYSDPPPNSDPGALYLLDLATVLNMGTPGSGTGQCTGSKSGTIYLPTGSVNNTSNASLSIFGQAIVNSWNVQSGNHTNPALTFNGCGSASNDEVLQLVQ